MRGPYGDVWFTKASLEKIAVRTGVLPVGIAHRCTKVQLLAFIKGTKPEITEELEALYLKWALSPARMHAFV